MTHIDLLYLNATKGFKFIGATVNDNTGYVGADHASHSSRANAVTAYVSNIANINANFINNFYLGIL